ncbi:GerAB/ArcD/ProY family transporter [Paenibacillus thalictri]|uniref:Spore gernimation protein n=1 Tax=Paenibacillus thalictri TaxID=2527873 RepID=A0A4V2J4P7_9BACL|nr:endospore germination permease [Paenibacillus thalictri]TBL80281.1 spore gernimation protein [Paenibacillus thalictri]
MLNNGKITSFQMGILMYPTILATAILIVPAITMKYAHRDAWISPMWASLTGLLLIYAVIRLNKLYPNHTIIEASEPILGRTLGKTFGFVFFFSYAQDTGFVIRQYGDFVIGNFLPRTPLIVVMGCMIFVCAISVRCGIEALARCAQLFVPLILFFLLLVVLLLTPDLHINHVLPVMESGIYASIKGAYTPAGWFVDFLFLSFFLPSLSDQEKAVKWAVRSMLAIMLTMVVTNIVIILLFGTVAPKLTYPVMVAARYISLADFLTHMEALVMAVWVMAIFLKICVYYYAFVLIFGQWLKLADYRTAVFPLGLLLVPYSLWVAPNIQYMAEFFDKSGVTFFMTIKLLLPLLLLAVAIVRNKRSHSPQNESGHS